MYTNLPRPELRLPCGWREKLAVNRGRQCVEGTIDAEYGLNFSPRLIRDKYSGDETRIHLDCTSLHTLEKLAAASALCLKRSFLSGGEECNPSQGPVWDASDTRRSLGGEHRVAVH